MGKVVVGSSAARYWLGESYREPNDLDIWQDYPADKSEGDVVQMPKEIMDLIEEEDGYATLDTLYTIKCSHLGWDIFWTKHKNDALVLQKHGAKLIEKLYNVLIGWWKEEHGNKDYLSLYQTKDEFFTDNVEYIHDHDYLHELVAHPNRPVYEKCLKDGEDVAIDYNKFMQLPFSERVRMFREEITVIACERWLIPGKSQGKVSWIQAYNYALRKTVTSLTKNWATDFLILNMKEFVIPDFSYFEYLLKTLNLEEKVMGKRLSEEESQGIFNELFLAYTEANPDCEYVKDYLSYEKEGKVFDEKLNEHSWEFFTENLLHDLSYNRYYPDGYKSLKQGGGEEHRYTIFEWRGNCYKYEYSYYSYEGCRHCDRTLILVEPKEKTITIYE